MTHALPAADDTLFKEAESAMFPELISTTVSAGEIIPADASDSEHLLGREAAVVGQIAEDWDGHGQSWTPTKTQWELKELRPLHRNVASLFAQGMKNVQIAELVGITPEYVSMLIRQPLVKAYISEMCEQVGTRMEALFAKSVDVIAETLDKGSEAGKLKAARLQLEATKRIGRPDPNSGLDRGNTDRLEKLAERLIQLQTGVRQGRIFNEDGTEVKEA